MMGKEITLNGYTGSGPTSASGKGKTLETKRRSVGSRGWVQRRAGRQAGRAQRTFRAGKQLPTVVQVCIPDSTHF